MVNVNRMYGGCTAQYGAYIVDVLGIWGYMGNVWWMVDATMGEDRKEKKFALHFYRRGGYPANKFSVNSEHLDLC